MYVAEALGALARFCIAQMILIVVLGLACLITGWPARVRWGAVLGFLLGIPAWGYVAGRICYMYPTKIGEMNLIVWIAIMLLLSILWYWRKSLFSARFLLTFTALVYVWGCVPGLPPYFFFPYTVGVVKIFDVVVSLVFQCSTCLFMLMVTRLIPEIFLNILLIPVAVGFVYLVFVPHNIYEPLAILFRQF